ncbi:MAG: PP2C family serine/threonine-protein phosphatase [Sandaracinaceae bacterium]
MNPVLHVGTASLRGRRTENQDALLSVPEGGLFAVADGVGGQPGGALAARLAISALAERATDDELTDDLLADLELDFLLARDRVAACAKGEYRGMGTTLIAARIDGPAAIVAHVGDSRAYLLQQGQRLHQVTRDHSLANKWRIAVGDEVPVPNRVARTLTRAISRDFDPMPEISAVELSVGDALLLCSDGVSGPLSEGAIARLLSLPAERAATALVEAATQAGGEDNATAVVIQPK